MSKKRNGGGAGGGGIGSQSVGAWTECVQGVWGLAEKKRDNRAWVSANLNGTLGEERGMRK